MKKIFVFALFSVFVLSACGANVFDATEVGAPVQVEGDERQRFIDATVEMSCMMMRAENLSEFLSADNRPAVNKQLDEIYKKYGFDVDDSEAMEALSKKYENDDDVVEGVQLGLLDC